jgi:hypothetical protein
VGKWIFGGVILAVVGGLLVLDWVMAGRVSRRLGRRPREDSQATLAAQAQAEPRRGEETFRGGP